MNNQTSNSHPIINIPESSLINLPTPSSISYIWNIGSLLGISLVIQIVSGILISIHYNPDTSSAFESTIHIIREVNEGNSSRAIHSNGASIFFIIIYMHVFRGILNSSPNKSETWASGTIIILILIATAFIGYVLPWGQMSFWGATVITNLASAIPIWGNSIVTWLWGGFSVSEPTLNRFLSLHFLAPFILAAIAIIHLALLHNTGSSNPLGGNSNTEMTPFHPLFSWNDTLAPTIVISIITAISENAPALLIDPENFSPANPIITPVHIQPEWYFLFAYAILRSIPNNLGGVLALVISIIILPATSANNSNKSSSNFNPKNNTTNILLATSFLILTWAGANPIEEPFIIISNTAGTAYFAIIIA